MNRTAIQEPTFLVLTALAAGPQHGYGIMTDVARISGDRVKLRAGTLYAALDRLRTDGIIDVDREGRAGNMAGEPPSRSLGVTWSWCSGG